ncbi:hypothetical protein EIP86_009551 [Pleurotus ostreatoroseus]|nr:hypothetical protein EIP86_009551 [Pleurotus ostreatoroseus]
MTTITVRKLEYGEQLQVGESMSNANTGGCGAVDIPTAVSNSLDAFEHDPLFRYRFDTPVRRHSLARFLNSNTGVQDSPGRAAERASQRIDFTSVYTQLVHRRACWTAENAASMVGYVVPEHEPDTFDKLLEQLSPLLALSHGALSSPEQKRRSTEIHTKADKAIQDVLGERRDAMLYITVVCTAPAAQGRGYASALLRIATATADTEKRATWLISSNAANAAWYALFGFRTRAEIVLGAENPTWRGAPVVLMLLCARGRGC